MSAAQTTPTYTFATGKPEKPIVDALITKYGARSITWPIIVSQRDISLTYLYEKSISNAINQPGDTRPSSRSGIPTSEIDYTVSPRTSAGGVLPINILDAKYTCSYHYIPSSPYNTVDLDYVWHNGSGFKGFELTTFFVKFETQANALRLISMMNRRPSWQGPAGAHALHKIVDSADDLSIDYYMVCVNTVSKVGSDILTDGHVLFFKLTHEVAEQISAGQAPKDSSFMTFDDFLDWL